MGGAYSGLPFPASEPGAFSLLQPFPGHPQNLTCDPVQVWGNSRVTLSGVGAILPLLTHLLGFSPAISQEVNHVRLAGFPRYSRSL